jgi:hypothetical protein
VFLPQSIESGGLLKQSNILRLKLIQGRIDGAPQPEAAIQES